MHIVLMLIITIGSYFLINLLVENEKLSVFLKGLLVGVMLLVVIISISSKPPMETTSNSDDSHEVIVNEEEKEPDTGLEINALLNEINFEFESDHGRYGTIREWKIKSGSLRAQINSITNNIEKGNFQRVKELLPQLHDQNNYITEIKINYMVAVFMSENNYKDALRIVLHKMKFEKESYDGDPKRFRFDMVYLLRYMYLNNGLEASKQLVDELKTEYPNSDLSYVWFTITVKNFDDLYSDGFEDPFKKGGSKEHYLKTFIATNPEDRFIDHAYYYLGDYQQIIDNYPESDIRSRAYYAKAKDLYHDMYHKMTDDKNYRWREGYIFEDEALQTVTNYFNEYFEDNAYGYFTYYGIEKLLNLYDWHYRKTGDYSWYIDLLEKMAEDSNKYDVQGPNGYYGYYSRSMTGLMQNVASSLMYEFSESEEMVQWPEAEKERIEGFLDIGMVNTINRGLANNAFKNDDFVKSKEYFDEVGDDYSYGYYYGHYLTRDRVRLLNELTNVIGKTDKKSLFRIANRLKDNHEKTLAIKYYEKLEKMTITDEELAQIYMYKAYCYRKLKMPVKMFLTHEYIAENLKKTTLADDALAETGLYYLLHTKETEKARQIFNQVIKIYPNSNTVNDAYNWIAWSYLRDRSYKKALEAYKVLHAKFPDDNFGVNALRNIKKIEEEK